MVRDADDSEQRSGALVGVGVGNRRLWQEERRSGLEQGPLAVRTRPNSTVQVMDVRLGSCGPLMEPSHAAARLAVCRQLKGTARASLGLYPVRKALIQC